MNNEQEKLIKEFLAKMELTLISKGNDYSSEQDTLKNFYSLIDLNIKPEMLAFIKINDKFSRLKNFIRKGKLSFNEEKIEDTLLDLANYCILLYLILKRENGINK